MKSRITRRDVPQKQVVLPIIGKIKIGKKSEKGYPMSVDYFIPTGKYEAMFRAVYGEHAQTIQVVFVDDDAEKVCAERYEYRNDQGELCAYGDGETFMVWNGKEYQELSVEQYPGVMDSVANRFRNKRTQGGRDGWDVILFVTFMVPMVRGVAGVWQFTTKGERSTIPNIRDVFDSVLERRGFVKGIIFDMSVQFAKSQKPGQKSRYPVVQIVPNESADNLRKIREAYKPVELIEKHDSDKQ
jgi:hypothetical protein